MSELYPSWKKICENNKKAPITHMFVTCVGRPPTDDELQRYIDLVVLPEEDPNVFAFKEAELLSIINGNNALQGINKTIISKHPQAKKFRELVNKN